MISPTRRPRARLFAAGLFAVFCAVSTAFNLPSAAQEASPSHDAVLQIIGKVGRPLTLHDADLAALPRRRLTVTDEHGNRVTYEGVSVADLLHRAGAPLGKQLRGPQLALYVLVSAADGYRAVFALPEFDPAFTDRVIVLADRRDGHQMAAPDGPFRVIVPDEKRHARWVREVTSLEVKQAQ
jgi:hypothetical protein